MANLEIRLFGDPVLRQRAHEVVDFDGRLARLAEDMTATMRQAEGVGLAANQVGVLRRMFTWEAEDDDGALAGGAVVNPTLVDASEDVLDGEEGCLSFPGLFAPVRRPLRVEVDYQQLDGEQRTTRLEGFFARIWLHEMDHLNGILFVDHLAKHDRQEVLRRMREMTDIGPTPPRAGGLLMGRTGL